MQYHSVYTNFSRGVSILILAGTDLTVLQVLSNKMGRYVFILCNLDLHIQYAYWQMFTYPRALTWKC